MRAAPNEGLPAGPGRGGAAGAGVSGRPRTAASPNSAGRAGLRSVPRCRSGRTVVMSGTPSPSGGGSERLRSTPRSRRRRRPQPKAQPGDATSRAPVVSARLTIVAASTPTRWLPITSVGSRAAGERRVSGDVGERGGAQRDEVGRHRPERWPKREEERHVHDGADRADAGGAPEVGQIVSGPAGRLGPAATGDEDPEQSPDSHQVVPGGRGESRRSSHGDRSSRRGLRGCGARFSVRGPAVRCRRTSRCPRPAGAGPGRLPGSWP